MDADKSTKSDPLIDSLRWIAFFPAAVLAAIIGHFLMKIVGFLGSSMNRDDSWLSYLFNDFLAHGAFGAAFVYAGCYVAPKGKGIVGIVLAAVAIFFSGSTFFINLAAKQWIGLLGMVGLIVGAVWVAVATYRGDIDY